MQFLSAVNKQQSEFVLAVIINTNLIKLWWFVLKSETYYLKANIFCHICQSLREKLIAANMAKMPQMVANWRREKREAKEKKREEKTKRDRLLAEARERFGYAMDPRSPKFLDMVKDLEKEEKKKKKLLKRRKREEEQSQVAPEAAAATTVAAASAPETAAS